MMIEEKNLLRDVTLVWVKYDGIDMNGFLELNPSTKQIGVLGLKM